MSALTITRMTLAASPALEALVGERIYAGNPPPTAAYPNIAIHLVFGADETLLAGAAQFPEARVSIECRSRHLPQADEIAELVVTWLQDKHLYLIDNSEVTFRKEGTDETDQSNSTGTTGVQDVSRRIVDFYARYRSV